MLTIAAVIPAHPPRLASGMLNRAVASVAAQTYPAAAISIAVDTGKRGAWHTRGRALAAVDPDECEWVAFLDSDDEWKPEHLALHAEWAVREHADFVYAWFEILPAGTGDPFPPWFFTDPWNPALPRHTTMTVMVRTELAQKIGFSPPVAGESCGNEDWRFVLDVHASGAKMVHIPGVRTWRWHRDAPDGFTEGMPDRW